MNIGILRAVNVSDSDTQRKEQKALPNSRAVLK